MSQLDRPDAGHVPTPPDWANELGPGTPPELLAPAGDWDCARAAIENGADAVYFGLESGFNARARAANFSLDNVDELMRMLHVRGVKGYVTLNTLVFHAELPKLAAAIERIAVAGVDAILVQDLGVARLAKQICPQLPIHASTQMTMTSAETIAAAADLGLARVVLARELSLAEIRKIAAASEMPLEAFIHGALCVAYSGQCLTSESLGGRSANRGQCAQACRLPYELVVDGQDQPLGDVRYLLSPQDLAGYAAIPQLIEAGVCSLKIEGRLKTPEYVANITSHYRRAIDQAWAGQAAAGQAAAGQAAAGQAAAIDQDDVREMEMSFSRGFTPGWLEGNDHKRLVPGTESAKRGVLTGEVVEIRGGRVVVELQGPLKRGDGVAFDGDRLGGHQQGGRLFGIWADGRSIDGEVRSGRVELEFGRGAIDVQKIAGGARLWKSDDPALNKRLRQSFQNADPQHRRPLDWRLTARAGQPLQLTARCGDWQVQVRSEQPLEAARNRPASEQSCREQLERLGGTPFQMGTLQLELAGAPMVPSSLLNQLRRQAVEWLVQAMEQPPLRSVDRDALPRLLAAADDRLQAGGDEGQQTGPGASVPELRVMCRTLPQVQQACELGIGRIYVDFHDIRQYRDAVQLVRQGDSEIYLSSVRIHKPGENGLFRALARHAADGYLVRNLAALAYFRDLPARCIADFSLNVVNPLTAAWLLEQGCDQVTASYDLNRDQLLDLVDAMPADRLEVVLHQQMPMFHMEHCVFCSLLSPGTNPSNCGRPCDRHQVQLRDRVGMQHPLQADVACRNTLYNAVPQSGAEAYEVLAQRGTGAIRVELLEQEPAEARRVIQAYQRLIAGQIDGPQVWQILQASNRVGVTRGTLEAARNPLAIL